MKKLLLILLFLPMVGLGQQTYVPDDNFEQALINLGYDNSLNDYVTTSNIDTITTLDISGQSISDLTGIEDFIALTYFDCSANGISGVFPYLPISLTYLDCSQQGVPFGGGIQVLDLSQNTALTYLNCNNAYIQSLNLQNGNNTNITYINLGAAGLCIKVDDPFYSENNWPGVPGYYSICCDNITYPDPCYEETYVPDDNFEQALINLGYDNYLDNYVYTANIDTITTLDISAQSISDLTGIEDFIALTYFDCNDNGISGVFPYLPISLTYLDCSNNFYISDIPAVYPSLTYLDCKYNQLTALDLTSTYSLTYLDCSDNQLTTLDVTNGNNINMYGFYTYNNSLQCIDVDDPVWSNSTWTFSNGNIDSGTSFSGDIINDTTVCNSYTFNGQTYTSSGTYSYNDIIAGCWNTIILNLTVNSTSNTATTAACYTYTWPFNGQTYTSSGTYIDTSTNSAGCDHTETLYLTINDSTSNTATAVACNTYTWSVNGQTYTTSGTDTVITTNLAGCHHTQTLNLTIEQNTSSYDTLSVNTSIVLWNGMSLNASGDYSATLINSVGCDSIANLNLTITTTGISDIANNKSNLVKITDVLGKETPYRRNTPLFYIYDDGTVEKRIVIE